ncbi:MAG: hypothetical protein ACK5R5_04185 [Alphaproteobacteria bacterium]
MSPPPSSHRSMGEKLFNWIVYGGLGGVGTFLLTLKPAYWMRYHGGEARIGRVLERIGIGGKIANQVATSTSLSLGGHMMLLPIAFAEAHHTQIVDGLNKMTLDPTPVEEIQAKPKPTLSSIIRGRLVAWAAVLSGFVAMGEFFPKTLDVFKNEFAEWFCKRTHQPMKVAGEETKAFRYGKLAALDVFATAFAATLLYIGSYFFARRKDAQQNPRPLPDSPHNPSKFFSEATFANEKGNPRPVTKFSERIQSKRTARVEEVVTRA